MSDTYAAYLLALAETPAKHAIVAHVDAYIMAANAQKARIRELESELSGVDGMLTQSVARIRELESRIEGMIEPHSDEQKRIRELESSIAALKNDRITWAMACQCACDACEVLSSRIAHLPTLDRGDEHGT